MRKPELTVVVPISTRVWDAKLGTHVGVMVDIKLDLASLAAQLGKKAYANNSHKTRALNGAIRGEVRP